MKTQDNESLIRELKKRVNRYMMEASEDEFDIDEVQTLLKLLDRLEKEQGENIEADIPTAEEALSDFWKYCQKREDEEKILSIADNTRKEHKVAEYVRRHKRVIAAAAILLVVILGGTWQINASAQKHGGFFWWMNKNKEGMVMITSPEETDKFEYSSKDFYYKTEDVPEQYRKYAQTPLEISSMREYELKMVKIIQRETATSLHIYLQDETEDSVHFQVVIYPKQLLRIREGYPGYDFEEEYEENGLAYEVFRKDEACGKQNYIVYFYNENVKYAVVGMENKERIKEIAEEYGAAVTENE